MLRLPMVVSKSLGILRRNNSDQKHDLGDSELFPGMGRWMLCSCLISVGETCMVGHHSFPAKGPSVVLYSRLKHASHSMLGYF